MTPCLCYWAICWSYLSCVYDCVDDFVFFFFFKQKTAYEIGLGIPAEPLFRSGQIGRLITISTTPVIAGDSFEMDAVGAIRLSPLRRGLAIDSTVDIFTFYVPHRHVYGEQWIKFMRSEERRVGKECRSWW